MANDKINLDLLTKNERAIYGRLSRAFMSWQVVDGLAALESLCAARQAAKDALGDLNAACDASEEVNHAGHVAVAIRRLERAVDGHAEPLACDWLKCGAPPATVCLLCEALLCEIHWRDDGEEGTVCLASCTPVVTAATLMAVRRRARDDAGR